MKRIKFGQYPQCENGEILPVTWLVIAEEEGKALLLSEFCLDGKPFHKSAKGVTWKDCTLRKWLNTDFLNAAFSEGEQEKILESDVTVYRKKHLNVAPNGLVKDKIFILSEEEIRELLDSEYWAARPTAYSDDKMDYRASGETEIINDIPVSKYACNWVTRMRCDSYAFDIACVDENGHLPEAFDVRDPRGIRPAIWVDKTVICNTSEKSTMTVPI